MIIDEAFMDCTPDKSMLVPVSKAEIELDNLIILRSVGKFFGLAGVRCGFVFAQPKLLSALEYQQGHWSVSGPTRWIVKKALADKAWIQHNGKRLLKESAQLHRMLEKHLISKSCKPVISGTALFKTVFLHDAQTVFQKLAQNGILVRLLDNEKGIRFGLPGTKAQWQRLDLVLEQLQLKQAEQENRLADQQQEKDAVN